MKRIALLAVIGGGLLALPSTAAAQDGATSCSYGTPAGPATVGPVKVGVTTGPPARACVNVRVDALDLDLGGEVVVDRGTASCSYINGWEDNPSNGAGYAGLCTDAASRGSTCSPGGGNGGENTGGCLDVDGNPQGINTLLNSAPQAAVTAMVICGDSSGENPDNTSRDGCSLPPLDCC